MSVRLAHLSDIHITATRLGWQLRDWFNKRLPGWINFRYLGRSFRFRRAEAVLAVLMKEVRERKPDRVIFSGDATAMGFQPEFEKAASLLMVSEPDLPGIAVPGNHDYYTMASTLEGHFERHFAPWQVGERVEGQLYPFAQRVGDYWLVAVNSSTANRWPWDASGRVDAAQLDRLYHLLDRLEPGPRILVTHFPVLLASGRHEHPTHGLRNLLEVIDVAARGGVKLWLHGHRHGHYVIKSHAVAPFPVICAGSATQSGLWGYNEYTLEGHHLKGLRRVFDFKQGRFVDTSSFEVLLPEVNGRA
ncbi:MAG: metallophosphoesterase [Gemmataceae bacterium]